MQRYFLVILLTVFGCFSALGQNIKQLFDEGKLLFDQGQYALALSKFEPLTAMETDNEMLRFASFYYAVSAYQSGDKSTAKNAFKQIQQKYPNWSIDNDLNYWQGVIAVEEGKTIDAFQYFNQVNSPELASSIKVLKERALASVNYIEQLKSLLIAFPETSVASKLASLMLQQDVKDQDLELLEQLETAYDLEISLTADGINYSPKKKVYNVGLFLPYAYRNDSARLAQLESNWTTRMYHGALLGVELLKEEGIEINLVNIDTRDASQRLEQMIASGQLDSLDLIIGPVTQTAVESMTKFSKEHKINMINPLSSNSEILRDNPYAFLYYPSNESLAIQSAEYAIKHFTRNKNAAIFYSGAADYERAELYRELIEKDSFNVPIFMRVGPEESVKIQQLFVEEEEVERDSITIARMFAEMDSLRYAGVQNWEKYADRDFVYDTLKILPDSIGHVFIASDFSSLSTSALSGIAARPDTIEFLSSSRFLVAEQSLSFPQLERLNAILVGSNHIDYATNEIAEFRRRYVDTYMASPVKEERLGDAYMAYDIVVTFGRLLHQYGKYFQVGLRRKDKVEGELTESLAYRLSNDNRYMPYLKVSGAKVVKVENQ
ncbi:MAG TPA: hypothetical protein VIN11_08430 [Roseivirga sp.]